ncbi:hypothetical protein GMD78_19715 [Ornithinibacillus sp. L9]|uniref:Uncharacterized protein n=1 Tax=Ornithinibacillus caprae TaxID=2678566 RepID=A0A6N8FRV2_9BACI|nr:hypothetical protein [Ornithinibacillus caprae]MUK90588.1 hypothetical protein [Ornithinibacillus caprae]
MSILIANCFHWVGFHLLNELLDRGIEVAGIDALDTDRKEHLSMFIGRNSSFSFIDNSEASNYETFIIIDNSDDIPSNFTSRKIKIGFGESREEKENIVHVHAPILYGEWMPMNEKGCLHQERFIDFDSEEFQSEAIYIGDFVKAFIQWLKVDNLPGHIEVRTKKNNEDQALKLENSIYIRDNVPKEENLKRVLAHYRRYKEFY